MGKFDDFSFIDVTVQFTSVSSTVSEGSSTTTVQLSAVGQREISVTVRYVCNVKAIYTIPVFFDHKIFAHCLNALGLGNFD